VVSTELLVSGECPVALRVTTKRSRAQKLKSFQQKLRASPRKIRLRSAAGCVAIATDAREKRQTREKKISTRRSAAGLVARYANRNRIAGAESDARREHSSARSPIVSSIAKCHSKTKRVRAQVLILVWDWLRGHARPRSDSSKAPRGSRTDTGSWRHGCKQPTNPCIFQAGCRASHSDAACGPTASLTLRRACL
jgi:hypothetical protein